MMDGDALREKIRTALKKVKNSYDFFVDTVDGAFVKHPEYGESFLQWLSDHPDVSSGGVLRLLNEDFIPGYMDEGVCDLAPDWYKEYTAEELKRIYGFESSAEAAADTPGTPEYEARMREEAENEGDGEAEEE